MGSAFQFANPTKKPRYVPKVNFEEDSLQKRVCSYLKKQYPHVIFRSDTASGQNRTTKTARLRHYQLQSSKSFPDLFIFHPIKHGEKHYCGLAIELKKDGTAVILKIGPDKGKLSKDPHIREQALMLRELNARGYYANFAVGYDQAVKIIDWYMLMPKHEAVKMF